MTVWCTYKAKSLQSESDQIRYLFMARLFWWIFTCESSYCFQRVLAIAILSVRPSACPSVTTGGSVKNGAS